VALRPLLLIINGLNPPSADGFARHLHKKWEFSILTFRSLKYVVDLICARRRRHNQKKNQKSGRKATKNPF